MKRINIKFINLTFSCILMIALSSCAGEKAKVWVASPWQTITQNTPPGQVQKVTVKAAANEYEPFRIIITNTGKEPLKDVNISVENLEGSGVTLGAENITLYRANYLNVVKPSARSKAPAGMYPDALIPFKGATSGAAVKYVAAPFSIDTAKNAEIWCDLYVPKGTKAGNYDGKIRVTSGRSKIAEIPVSLTVWNFELPDKISMQSHFGALNESNASMMGIEMGSPEFTEMEKLYDQLLLKHRAVPATPKYAWPEWDEKQGIADDGKSEVIRNIVEKEGFNALDIPFRFKDDPKKCIPYLHAMADWLRKAGYLKLSYIYMEDEPNDAKEYEIVRKQGAMIKKADPEIGRMCTEQTIPSKPEWGNLYGAVTIWCPLWGLWNDSTAQQRLALGEQLWSYTALCQGPEGTPWWQVDMDPLNFRSPMWISWHYNITGFLYWSSSWWNTYGSPEGVWEAPYFRKNYWGEGMLVYPGKPAGIKGFVPSIRLKLYRESAEDYEYMVMAKSLGNEADADRIVDGIATSFQKWSHDRDAYEKAREELANLIMKK
jgi:hypothetical protein